MGFRGANLTIPHQQAVIPYLDELSPAAELSGSVNCVSRVADRLIGDNTDGRGFLHSLREITDPAGKRVVVLGAGSAATAIAAELALAEASQLTIVNRSADRGEALAELIRNRTNVDASFTLWEGEYAVDPSVDVLVQATSIGFYEAKANVPIQQDTLHPAPRRRGRRLPSSPDSPAAGRCRPGMPYARWAWHARSPGRDRIFELDRDAAGSECDARRRRRIPQRVTDPHGDRAQRKPVSCERKSGGASARSATWIANRP